ncbi:DUF1642 domain-containing protein [Sporosarcina jiandibaonis]|uniref:DUF1642 domain-containing protein n=1 Tax=Sporosarcina jiandibaonis TaxID=2715535 RepID=UPI001FEA92CA|nr:DUF1642 domain-containing protein [Sporosarcina jiandibaonis]
MGEKVKIPQNVADAIEKLRKVHSVYGVVAAVAKNKSEYPTLSNSIDALLVWTHEEEGDGYNADRLIQALVNGYEIEPKYKVGDWVANLDGSNIFPKGDVKVVEVGAVEKQYIRPFGDKAWGLPIHHLRHATSEEIKAEKERQKWAEIEPGDVLIHKVTGEYGTFDELAEPFAMIRSSRSSSSFAWNKEHCVLYAKKVNKDV